MRKIVVNIIDFYQKYISSYLSQMCGIHCKFEPTCSEYTKQAIKKYGIIQGSLKGLKRMIRCNPFSKGGYDPLK